MAKIDILLGKGLEQAEVSRLSFLTYLICKQVVFCSLRHAQAPLAIFGATFLLFCHAHSAHA